MDRKLQTLTIAAGVLLIAFIVAVIVDGIYAEHVPVGSAVVVDKVYSPAIDSHGTGVAYSSRDGVTPVNVHTHSQEAWIVIVRINGDAVAIDCPAGVWGQLEKGHSCVVLQKRGVLFNHGMTIQSEMK